MRPGAGNRETSPLRNPQMTRIRETHPSYLSFLKLAAAILVGLFALGYLPTVRSAGEDGVPAMFAGGGVSLAASVAGTVPFLLSQARTAVEIMPAVMGSIALRLGVVVVLAAAVVWSGMLATRPLLVWVALSHAGLLVADTLWARGRVRSLRDDGRFRTSSD